MRFRRCLIVKTALETSFGLYVVLTLIAINCINDFEHFSKYMKFPNGGNNSNQVKQKKNYMSFKQELKEPKNIKAKRVEQKVDKSECEVFLLYFLVKVVNLSLYTNAKKRENYGRIRSTFSKLESNWLDSLCGIRQIHGICFCVLHDIATLSGCTIDCHMYITPNRCFIAKVSFVCECAICVCLSTRSTYHPDIQSDFSSMPMDFRFPFN